MVAGYIDALRLLMKTHDYDRHTDGCGHLVGYKGHLYAVYVDLQINRYASGVVTMGSAGDFALGAYHALIFWVKSPDACIQQALMIADKLSCDMSAPYHFEVM